MDRAETMASGHPSPEDAVQTGQLEEAALSVLGQLSASDQETLRAAFFEDLEGRPLVAGATFRKRRERAMARLRELWRTMYGSA